MAHLCLLGYETGLFPLPICWALGPRVAKSFMAFLPSLMVFLLSCGLAVKGLPPAWGDLAQAVPRPA
jgi:hypothetical protein